MPTLTEIAKHLGVTQPRASQLKKEGMPINSLRAALLWRNKQTQRRNPTNNRPANVQTKKKGRPRNPAKLSKTGDTLTDILRNTIATAEVAFQVYHNAAIGDERNQAVLLSNHTKAAEAVAKIERMVREEQERRGVLVNKSVMAEKIRRCMETILRGLRKLPAEAGPQMSGLDPIQAVTFLQERVDELLTAGQQALHDL